MRKKGIVFVIYLIIGIYLLNMGFGIINFPEALASFLNKWVVVLAGLLLLFAGMRQSGIGRRNFYY
jgi:hypothetical protein